MTETTTVPPLSTELALMLRESDLERMASTLCFQCAHSTVLQLAFPPEPDEKPEDLRPSEMVIYCGAMSRDITVPVKRCSAFVAKP